VLRAKAATPRPRRTAGSHLHPEVPRGPQIEKGAPFVASPLQITLSRLVQSHSEANPAFRSLLNDYTKYHVVLLVFGGLLELLTVWLCVFAWSRWRTAPRTVVGKLSFEKRTYLSLAALTTVVSLAFAFGLAANATTVMNPWHGFSAAVSGLGSPRPGTQLARIFDATNAWIDSDSVHMPAEVHAAVEHRVSWQLPRAIIFTILIVVCVLLSARIWSGLIARSRVRGAPRRVRDRLLVLVGIGTVLASLLATVLAVLNMRPALAPLAYTVLAAGGRSG
jgi:hypothetical protein